jgi:hypothetical protein
MKLQNSKELFDLLSKNKVGVFVAESFENDRKEGSFAENNTKQKYTWLIIKSKNRNERLDFIIEFLDRKQIKYKITSWSRSTFPYISIIPESKKEIRIVFKFLRYDKKNYKWWNERLDNLFSSTKVKMITPSDKNEIEVVTTINKKIEELGNNLPVNLKIQNKIFKNVIGFNGGDAGKKADFVIIDKNGESIGYISYKVGYNAKSFQQYAGIQKTPKKNEDSSLFLSSDSEVKSFVSKMEEFYESDKNYFEKGVIYSTINQNLLKNKAVFGEQYGKQKSQNNVDFLAQGIPKLVKSGNNVVLYFGKKLVANGQLTRLSGDYEPVLGIRKAEASRYLRSIKGVRGGIWPKKYMTTRKNSRNLKNIE